MKTARILFENDLNVQVAELPAMRVHDVWKSIYTDSQFFKYTDSDISNTYASNFGCRPLFALTFGDFHQLSARPEASHADVPQYRICGRGEFSEGISPLRMRVECKASPEAMPAFSAVPDSFVGVSQRHFTQ